MQFSRLKALLKLSDEALELADRHNLDERKLRPILEVSPEYHAEIVRQVVDFNLTSKQVEELCVGEVSDNDSDTDPIPASAAKIAKAALSTNSISAQDIARALIKQEGDLSLAKARLNALRRLLAETENYLTE